jgi:hypothetical protein
MSSKKNNFIDFLAKIGLKLAVNDSSILNVLSIDQRAFQTKLKNSLLQTKDASVKEVFLQNCKRYLDTEANFLVALLPTKNDMEQMVSHSSNQDSLIKLLLEIDELQLTLFDYLIQKLLEYSENNMTSDTVTLESNMQIHVPTYIINQFRYQPKIVDADQLCCKVMDVINSISNKQIKKGNQFNSNSREM